MSDESCVGGVGAMPAPRQLDHSEVQTKYVKERDKRLRADGHAQFIDLAQSEEFSHHREDPWAGHEALNVQKPRIENDSHIKYLIIGAGYGGLLFATRLRQAGISANDICIVDSAGGFGGTWYWNRCK